MVRSAAASLFLVACTAAQPAVEDDASCEAPAQCALFMAESSIPNSGLGMFTAKEIAENQRIFSGDIVCNVEDMEENMALRNRLLQRQWKEPEWLLENYYWDAGSAFSMNEAAFVQAIVPGLGHMGLINCVMRGATNEALLQRGSDPGTGGSTNYHDVHYYAGEGPIEAGAELFVEYGDDWFVRRTPAMGELPLQKDFPRADSLLQEFDEIAQDTTPEQAQKIYGLLRHAVDNSPRLLNAFPGEASDVSRVLSIGGTAENTVPNRVRSYEWLTENGRCLDNIRPAISTIKQAGRGAFATRHIAKGHVVAPLPMVHLRRYHMEVFEEIHHDTQGNKVSPNIRQIGYQLLMNYCYGHPESTLLLFPYAPVVNYVNHNSTGANVALQWSNLPNNKVEWMEQSPEEFHKIDHAGLVMELVATRDIAKGEEVFLDYGPRWGQAWDEHVANFAPDQADRDYVAAATLEANTKFLRTVDELEENPYENPDVFTMCFTATFDDVKVRNPGKQYKWRDDQYLMDDSQWIYPCDILSRNEETNTYQVRLEIDQRKREATGLVSDVPRDAIRFFDEEYTSDLTWRKAFRHSIDIPDHIFPDAWKDKKGKGKQS